MPTPTPDAPERAPQRETVARHGRLHSPHPLSQLLTIVAAVLAVVLVSGVSVGAFAFWDATRAVADNSVDISSADEAPLPPEMGEIEGGVNMLVVGTDSCEGQDLTFFPRCADEGDAPGERNDVTMLVHISDSPRRVTVVSFPRDMIVPIPSCTDADGYQVSAMSAQPLNVSYYYGGLPCTVATIEQLTGVNIQFAASMRWTGVINMADAIGGVDVCIEGQIDDENTGLHLAGGQHTLTGIEALQFLRIRHGIGDGSDLGRISNQQQFMSSMVRKLQSGGVLSNPSTLFGLATTAIGQVESKQMTLSSSLANPTRMVQIAMAVKSVPYSDIVFVQYPTAYASGYSGVVPIYDSADVLFQALTANQPIQLTGDASSGYAVEVTGEAADPNAAAATPAPTDPAAAPDAAAGSAPVALPSDISGQTAAQVTCTVPEQ